MNTKIFQSIIGLIILIHNITGDDLGLLSSTLRSFRTFCCDDELLKLVCPLGTSISVELVQYGVKEGNDTAQCPYSGLDDLYYDPESSPSSSSTSMLDITLAPGNVTITSTTPNYNEMDVAMNDSLTSFSIERTKGKCTPLYVLQYSILQTIVETCQKKRRCRLHAAPKIFETSPCPGIHRLVEVNHKCRPFEFRSLTSCEKDIVRLTCGQYTRIAIYSATYGRTAYESSHCSQAASSQEQTCLSEHTSHTLTEICQGRRKCTVAVESSTFGNPCPDSIRVYLKVIYACVSRNVFRERYITPLEDDELDERLFESNEQYDEELTPVPNQIESSAAIGNSGAKGIHNKYLGESSKAEDIITFVKDDETQQTMGGLDHRQLLIVSVAALFCCCICLSFGALLAYKMKLFPSRTGNRCNKESDSFDSHSTPSSYRPTSEDFDLADCVPKTVVSSEKLAEQQLAPSKRIQATNSSFGNACIGSTNNSSYSTTIPAFSFGGVRPSREAHLSHISTTMFILPNYLMTEAPTGSLSDSRRPLRSAPEALNEREMAQPNENLTLTLTTTEITGEPGSYNHLHPDHQQKHKSANYAGSCTQCAVLGWSPAPPISAGVMYAAPVASTGALHPYQRNHSLKSSSSDACGRPDLVRCEDHGAKDMTGDAQSSGVTLTKSNSFLWLGLKIGLT
ncbi:protein eva-1-like [Anopheles bellator]|uniref:protein eva-1-like n=1 Tax=Anopheles bellator TaxID=139047 RepID=UPI0026485807|nr:protein eva-1-like [Anopheles bellator]